MDRRTRLGISLVIAVVVSVPLLPEALDDAGSDGAAVGDPPASDNSDDPADPGDSSDQPSPSSTAPAEDDDSDRSGDGSEDDQPSTTTSDPGTTPGEDDDGPAPSSTTSVPTVTTTPAPAPSSGLALSAGAVGELVAGEPGTVAATVTNARATTRPVVVTVEVADAAIVDAPGSSCSRSALTVVCSVEVPGGSTAELVIAITVADGASSVTVTVSAAVAGPDPAPVTVTLPTASSGLVTRALLAGDYRATVIGNSSLSCPDGASSGGISCESVRAGSASAATTNDDWAMEVVAADDRGSGSSSAADLASVDVGTVERALLVWGASTDGAVPGAASSVRFATPVTTDGGVPDGNDDYASVTAITTTALPGAWQSVADVTALVDEAGEGRFWVADVAADPGPGAWAGWALVVISAGDGGRHQVAVLEGLRALGPDLTTLALPGGTGDGPVEITTLMWDGDRGVGGEALRVEHDGGPTPLFGGVNPGSDVANSTVSVAGTAVDDRVPAPANGLGVDIDTFAAGTIAPTGLSAQGGADDVWLGLVVVST